MTNSKDKQEAPQRRMGAEREELEQAAERFLRSMLRTGVSLALLLTLVNTFLLPATLQGIPQAEQKHIGRMV